MSQAEVVSPADLQKIEELKTRFELADLERKAKIAQINEEIQTIKEVSNGRGEFSQNPADYGLSNVPDYNEMYRRVIDRMEDDRDLARLEQEFLADVTAKEEAWEEQKLIRETMQEFKADKHEILAAKVKELEKKKELRLARLNLKVLARRIKINEGHRIGILALRKHMISSGG